MADFRQYASYPRGFLYMEAYVVAAERRVQLRAAFQEAGNARLRGCTSRGSTAMATLVIALASCNC